VPERSGGNAQLRPERGTSESFGIVYVSEAIEGLELSLTQWRLKESETIESNVPPQYIVDNAAAFPGRVVRDPSGSIVLVDDSLVNFGSIEVAGLDYHANYARSTRAGVWSGSLSLAQTYRYRAQLVAGGQTTNQVSVADDTSTWAPRWKGAIDLGWHHGPLDVHLDGRYVSRYQDYDSTREIGNVWLSDAHLRLDASKYYMSRSAFGRGVYLEAGAVNLFNRAPQYSNYASSLLGYDPTQADIRGRYLYVTVGAKL
jgi:outer membrane receptor protein involved in Fe transport